MKISILTNLSNKLTKLFVFLYFQTYCKYKFYTRSDYSKTSEKLGNNPKYGHEEIITIPSVDFKVTFSFS